ncbi:lantibiotic protection ABC transporter ATP-binding protein [Muricomes sp. OA1]|uniref:Lantibiotic protection ABC transporter ATP-binding subunit n=2 Tax=Lachnospiraceae TaxID=186803 RepID=A0A3E2WNC0_9FIRM|nr:MULTISPECIES: lantibiotic protection ABC transporter ATP-binding protein [Clostridia]MEE0200521.1 lantibiotic protection ABC transporter ATP-binding protein [Muricomes sp.]MCH1973724.1 lantibiotic protection ABC transporter ATP-binding protein [Muricomes sp. OA1]MRM91089.1 lantibiotic protection ABC transporter ATP-binding subunit [Faecalicatena contorta]RGC28187.1 lantibiotic protection ABC transporter ATP-binding subunit [Hungatella hathewayi]GKH32490.1 lantibiotic ABC transporter ATP-bin
MNEMILETKGICKRFGRQVVLNQVSLMVPKGCVYGLLGPNGAGKSTLMKMFSGMMRPDEGEIFFRGKPWSRKDLNRTGALIEQPPLYDNLTARENLEVRTLLLGLPKKRIDEVLEIVDLKNTGKKRAGQFSMGMKQRLGIAAALLNKPSLLILDEPANGLDPFGIQELRNMIRDFSDEGITVIVSSHILSEVEQVADYIGIISGGVLGYQGGMKQGKDLEGLFTDVVKKNRGLEACC